MSYSSKYYDYTYNPNRYNEYGAYDSLGSTRANSFNKAYMDYDRNKNREKEIADMYRYKQEPQANRGVVDRVFDVLSTGQYAVHGAITEASKGYKSNGLLGGFAGAVEGAGKGIWAGVSGAVPFANGNEEWEYSTKDSMNEITNGAWETGLNGVGGKIVKGITEFAGDVLLDPTTYIGGGVAKGLVKGTGTKVASRSGMKVVDEITENTVRELIEQSGKTFKYNDAGVTRVTDKLNKAKGVIRSGTEDITFMGKKVIDGDSLRSLGDKTIAPYYNALVSKTRDSQVGKLFSTSYSLRKFAMESPEEAFEFIDYLDDLTNMKKTKILKDDSVRKKYDEIVSALPEDQRKAVTHFIENPKMYMNEESWKAMNKGDEVYKNFEEVIKPVLGQLEGLRSERRSVGTTIDQIKRVFSKDPTELMDNLQSTNNAYVQRHIKEIIDPNQLHSTYEEAIASLHPDDTYRLFADFYDQPFDMIENWYDDLMDTTPEIMDGQRTLLPLTEKDELEKLSSMNLNDFGEDMYFDGVFKDTLKPESLMSGQTTLNDYAVNRLESLGMNIGEFGEEFAKESAESVGLEKAMKGQKDLFTFFDKNPLITSNEDLAYFKDSFKSTVSEEVTESLDLIKNKSVSTDLSKLDNVGTRSGGEDAITSYKKRAEAYNKDYFERKQKVGYLPKINDNQFLIHSDTLRKNPSLQRSLVGRPRDVKVNWLNDALFGGRKVVTEHANNKTLNDLIKLTSQGDMKQVYGLVYSTTQEGMDMYHYTMGKYGTEFLDVPKEFRNVNIDVDELAMGHLKGGIDVDKVVNNINNNYKKTGVQIYKSVGELKERFASYEKTYKDLLIQRQRASTQEAIEKLRLQYQSATDPKIRAEIEVRANKLKAGSREELKKLGANKTQLTIPKKKIEWNEAYDEQLQRTLSDLENARLPFDDRNNELAYMRTLTKDQLSYFIGKYEKIPFHKIPEGDLMRISNITKEQIESEFNRQALEASEHAVKFRRGDADVQYKNAEEGLNEFEDKRKKAKETTDKRYDTKGIVEKQQFLREDNLTGVRDVNGKPSITKQRMGRFMEDLKLDLHTNPAFDDVPFEIREKYIEQNEKLSEQLLKWVNDEDNMFTASLDDVFNDVMDDGVVEVHLTPQSEHKILAPLNQGGYIGSVQNMPYIPGLNEIDTLRSFIGMATGKQVQLYDSTGKKLATNMGNDYKWKILRDGRTVKEKIPVEIQNSIYIPTKKREAYLKRMTANQGMEEAYKEVSEKGFVADLVKVQDNTPKVNPSLDALKDDILNTPFDVPEEFDPITGEYITKKPSTEAEVLNEVLPSEVPTSDTSQLDLLDLIKQDIDNEIPMDFKLDMGGDKLEMIGKTPDNLLGGQIKTHDTSGMKYKEIADLRRSNLKEYYNTKAPEGIDPSTGEYITKAEKKIPKVEITNPTFQREIYSGQQMSLGDVARKNERQKRVEKALAQNDIQVAMDVMREEVDEIGGRIKHLEDALRNDETLTTMYNAKFKEDVQIKDGVAYIKHISKRLESGETLSDDVVQTLEFMIDEFRKMGVSEEKMGLLHSYVKKYAPHIINPELLKNPDVFGKLKAYDEKLYEKVLKYKEGKYNPFDQSRKLNGSIKDVNENMKKAFKKAGVDFDGEFFIEDVAEIYLARSLKHNELLYTDEFLKRTFETFGEKVDLTSPKLQKGKYYIGQTDLSLVMKSAPKEVQQELLTKLGLNEGKPLYAPLIEVDEKMGKELAGVLEKYDLLLPVTAYQLDDAVAHKIRNTGKIHQTKDTNGFLKAYDKALQLWKQNVTLTMPGFHVRNAFSNYFQNYLAMGTKVFDPEFNKTVHSIQKGLPGEIVTKSGQKYSYDDVRKLADLYEITSNGMVGKELGLKARVEGKTPMSLNPLNSQDFFAYRMGRSMGSTVENYGRMQNFVGHLQEGMDVQDAVDMTNHFLFDYSDLTQFEHQFMKRAMPFYTWLRKNAPLQVEQLVNNPGRYSVIPKALNGLENAMPEEDKADKRFLPEFMQDWVQLPLTVTNPEGREEIVMFNPSMPYDSLNDLDPRLKNMLKNIWGKTTPFLKVPVEMATGYNFFFESPIYDKGDYLLEQSGTPNAIYDLVDKQGLDRVLHLLNSVGGMKFSTYDYDKYTQHKYPQK